MGALPAQCTVTAIVIAVQAEIRELVTASIATASEVGPQPRLPTPPPHLRSPCQIMAVLHRVASLASHCYFTIMIHIKKGPV